MQYNNIEDLVSQKFIKNSIYKTVAYIWPIIVAFITIPIIVNNLGTIEYGLYIFVGTTLSLFGLVDLGVSTAITKFIAEKVGQKDIQETKKYIGVAKAIFTSMAVSGSLLLLCVSAILLVLFEGKYSFMSFSFVVVSITFFISTVQSTMDILLQANQRFDILSKFGIIFMTLQQFLLVLVAIYFKNIELMFVVQLFIAIFTYFIVMRITNSIFPEIKTRMIFDWLLIKKFYKFGLSTFFVSFTNSLLTYFDRFLIPILLGPQSLTYYSVPGTISSKIPGFSSNIGSVIFSMSSSFSGANDHRRQEILYTKSIRIILIVSLSLALSVSVYSKEILGYWISFDIANKSHLILILLSITSVFLSLYIVINNILIGMGKLRELAITTAIMLVINLISLFIFLPMIGVVGAALSYLISVLPVFFLKTLVDKKYFNINFFNRTALFFNVKISLILLVVFMTSLLLKLYIVNMLTAIIFFSVSNFLFIGFSYLLGCIEKEEFNLLKKFLIYRK